MPVLLNCILSVFSFTLEKSLLIHSASAIQSRLYNPSRLTASAAPIKRENPIVFVNKQNNESDKDELDAGALAKEELYDNISDGDPIVAAHRDKDGHIILDMKGEESMDDLTSSKKEQLMSGEFLLIAFLVLLSWGIEQLAHYFKIYAIQMPLVCSCIGVAVGIGLRVTNDITYLEYLEFSDEVFFMLLLPPIIFESGFNLDIKEMHKNATAIFYYAFLGTLLSFMFSSLGLALCFAVLPFQTDVNLSAKGILSFAAVVSATDPVSVVALFKEIPVLGYFKAIIIGESLMNDAISISLYRTFSRTSSSGVLGPIFGFILLFLGSVILGFVFGWITAFIFRLFKSITAETQICILILFSYIAYLCAEFIGCSGIVAILFCGVCQALYTLPNMNQKTADAFRLIIQTLSFIAETVAFIYLGMATCFLSIPLVDIFVAIAVTIPIITCSRWLAMMGTAKCLKYLHHNDIPNKAVSALTLCGLRGAVAFGLAKHARHDYGHGMGGLILASTLGYSLFTVIVLGPAIPFSLRFLGLFMLDDEGSKEFTTEEILNVQIKTQYESRVVRIMKSFDRLLKKWLLVKPRSDLEQESLEKGYISDIEVVDLNETGIPNLVHDLDDIGVVLEEEEYNINRANR